MTTTTTAAVEVLTAEVRVLMVGSRQVTLSVFAQLDTVPYGECEPMGRVNPREGGKWVVGRDPHGTLVRAILPSKPRWEAEDALIRARDHLAYSEKIRARSGPASRPVTPETSDWMARDIEATKAEIAELEGEKREIGEEQAEWLVLSTAFHALPLIVLAGLRG